jgi:hypothetical protein
MGAVVQSAEAVGFLRQFSRVLTLTYSTRVSENCLSLTSLGRRLALFSALVWLNPASGGGCTLAPQAEL